MINKADITTPVKEEMDSILSESEMNNDTNILSQHRGSYLLLNQQFFNPSLQ